MRIYFDNAATTAMDTMVIERISNVMKDVYGNPSAIHGMGRKARAEIELARRSIAKWINCQPSEIYFTGSGTEADNMALRCAVNDLGVKHIITTAIEHKAVLDTAMDIVAKTDVKLHMVNIDHEGKTDMNHLRELAAAHKGALISIMHANNEIGTINNIVEISSIARENDCYFHTDTVQTMGHYTYNLEELDVDFLTCSAHKFHGPKGVGFLYKNKKIQLRPIITGGGQESKLRAGTENVIGIVGLAEAMNQAYLSLDTDKPRLEELKQYCISQLKERIPGVKFNGNTSVEGSLYTVLNISIPPYEGDSTLLYQMDIEGVCVSGGSACNSGAVGGSHVLEGIGHPNNRSAVRFSFSKHNTKEEVNQAIKILCEIVAIALPV
ncbi:MAG: cysteine desulfurase [Bacteroidia bacterium]